MHNQVNYKSDNKELNGYENEKNEKSDNEKCNGYENEKFRELWEKLRDLS